MSIRRIGTLVCSLLAAACFTVGAAYARDSATLRLDWLAFGNVSPFYLGLDKGFYAEQGIDLTIFEGTGSGTTVKLIGAGSDTFGYADYGAMAKAISEGVPVKGIYGILQKSTLSIVSLADSGLREPKDLAGKTVATAPGGASGQILGGFLTAQNLTDSVRVVNIKGESKTAALLAGQVDAMTGTYHGQIPLIEDKGVKTAAMRFADWGMNVPSHGLLAHRDTIAQKPDLVRRFVAATAKSFEYAMKNPDESVETLMKYLPQHRERVKPYRDMLLRSFELMETPNTKGKPIGWQSEENWKAAIKLLSKYGQLKGTPRPDEFYTNQFIPGSGSP